MICFGRSRAMTNDRTMKILLDTCTFLWAVRETSALSPLATALITDAENEVFLSAISAWEMAVKHGLGKLKLDGISSVYISLERARHRIASLPLDEDSATAVSRLPLMHADPFDWLLICQAITHGMTLLTPDARIHQYPVNVKW